MLEFVTGALIKLLNRFKRRERCATTAQRTRATGQCSLAWRRRRPAAQAARPQGRFSIFDVVARPVPMAFVFFSTADMVRRKVGSLVGVQSFVSKRETPRRWPPYVQLD